MKTAMKSLVLTAVLLFATVGAQATTVNPFTDLGSGGPAYFTILSQAATVIKDGSVVSGNVAVVQGGSLSVSTNSNVYGKADVDTSDGSVSGAGQISGGVTQTSAMDTLLDAAGQNALDAYTDAQTGSNIANYKLVSVSGNTINDPTTQQTITGTAGKINVVNLTALVLNSETHDLVLNGPSTASFIINISGAFSLTNGADITFTGGLTEANVIYNVIGSGSAVCFSAASTCTSAVSSQGSTINGIVLAPYRDVTLDGAVVNGEVVVGNMNLTIDDSKLVPEPSTLLAFATGLAALGGRFRWMRRRSR
jgi:choice-of-anchor A domain-containing protein